MRYNVAQLLKEGIGASRRFAIDGSLGNLDENDPRLVPVHGELTLLRTERGVLVSGEASIPVNGECRRCLSPVVTEVRFALEEEYISSVDMETGAQLPITDEDDPELVIDEHHVLDISEVVRQVVVMESSASVLCRADCKGLCPRCGKDLNLGPCGCAEEAVDPRLAVLEQLLDTDSRQA